MEIVKIDLNNSNERPCINQWDKGRQLLIAGVNVINGANIEVHFSFDCNFGDAVRRIPQLLENGDILVDIPAFITENIKCDSGYYAAYVWIYQKKNDIAVTSNRTHFRVKTRAKPEDYVYTPEEKKTWDDLKERIKKLEENGGSGSVDLDLGGTVEITSGTPEHESTVMTVDPNAKDINLYVAEEIDKMFGSYATDVAALVGGIE